MAPRVGLEPTTNRLTADRSTTELPGNGQTYNASHYTARMRGSATQHVWLLCCANYLLFATVPLFVLPGSKHNPGDSYNNLAGVVFA